jgi:type I restriction enzyme, R subunit
LTILTPEQKAREHIDQMLEAAGWQVQTHSRMNRTAAPGVVVCEFPLTTGETDYMLLAEVRPIGVVEAKPEGTPLSGVEPQARKYAEGLSDRLRSTAWHNPLPFRYEFTGIETFFADDRDANARSRCVYTFHRPETLISWARQPDTLATRLRQMPDLHPGNLWPVQIEAIRNLERIKQEAQ